MSIPVEFIFCPQWWYRNCGISFDEAFYLDRERRIENDVRMRRYLFERFGFGERDPQPRPMIGSSHVAGGFVLPAVLGVPIRFSADQAPVQLPVNLSDDGVWNLKVPDLESVWPMAQLRSDAATCVAGDWNLDGVFNTALQIRGEQLFIDMMENAPLVEHLMGVIAQTHLALATWFRSVTGTSSIAANRSIVNVDPGIHLHCHCSLQMISPALYRTHIFPFDRMLAEKLQPFGIHHCGSNAHRFAALYHEAGIRFLDVGWGSDVAACSRLLPDTFLNLRLSPIRMLQVSPSEMAADVKRLLEECGRTENVGVCCINMDYGTPDESIRAVVEAVTEYRA